MDYHVDFADFLVEAQDAHEAADIAQRLLEELILLPEICEISAADDLLDEFPSPTPDVVLD